MSRELDDWISSYLRYVQNTEPPGMYHLWCAITTISAILQRKCRLEWGSLTFFPNMYVVLVGPPAARKGTSMNLARGFLEDLQIKASADLGGLFIDGYGDGICLSNDHDNITFTELKDLSFGILQASRMRVSQTEFISCPGCGRTLFDLHETTKKIKEHFSHLQHLKIGIMGCVVNGPGEMSDADYGFVGAGKNNVNLYKGQKLVKRHIPYENAVEELEQLIRESGDWIDR